MAENGSYLVDAAKDNNVYIPTLCNMPGVKPKGSCRMCSVKINGKLTTACTTRIVEGMNVENETDEIKEIRSTILAILFSEGNHFCPSCERSGSCDLQALAYKFEMIVPSFPYQFPLRHIESSNPKILKDHNRCILCKRCIRAVKNKDGKSVFAFRKRGIHVEISIDTELAAKMTDEMAQKAVDSCPVGAILKKGNDAFKIPMGQRQYDKTPIGSDIEQLAK